jgi:anti-sigma B factor antagonist
MNVETKQEVTIARLEGSLDLAAYERLHGPLHALFDENAAKVIVDLRKVHFIDSIGWGLLLSVLHQARRMGGHLKLLHMSEHLGTVFTLLTLERVFEVFDDEETALKSYRPLRRSGMDEL